MNELAWIVVLGLATWQVVEVFHHSKITLAFRKWASTLRSAPGVRGFFAEWVECAFCHSHWFAAALVIGSVLLLPWFKYIIYIFAATRVANFSNDIFYNQCKTPKHDTEEEDEDGSTVESGDAGPDLEYPGDDREATEI